MEGIANRSACSLAASLVAVLLALAPSGASAARAAAPDDRAFAAQWQLADDEPMGIRGAWSLSTGGDVTVAIVDTGAQLDHPDLAPNLWTNPGEIAGNGVDDDANGYIDDVHGYDFAGHDADPSDENGHGTHVAGVVGARGDNATGVAGVAWRVRLMIVRALAADGSATAGDVARGIRYAVANGARIVNLSMSGPADDPAIERAIAQAEAAGALIVAAAGNRAADLDVRPSYPAASPSPAVIAVASSDEDGRLAASSSFGRASVDIAAPGEDIDSTERGGRYGERSGTSQAAAQVSGVLALMAAAAPSAPAALLRARLLAGARTTALPVAAGALDAGGALRGLLGRPVARRAKTAARSAAQRRPTAARAVRRAPARPAID